ncbi:putative mynd finger family protein [Botrytis fragariae]|uniref:Putative mynd finger family protein n=1 Tax=Botrytis fragariae TaxID=1964551 RepID=A0A8H6AJG0_9HELO|nr:putative mynd finger family protein [Botrytis fragariae]KAF5868777.1 putative mynd finger family protein [Botrytis fragariae]
MLGPTRFNVKPFFYPFGNTPAINLLQSRRPAREKDDAAQLLMLYPIDELIKWEFMCCDSESAILARNILLFSLVIDNEPYASIWNIFYHFYITNTDNAVLQKQICKLLQQSANLEVWSSSNYGASICFMNQDTLDQVREMWSQYLEVANLRSDSKERDHFETKFKAEVKSTMREQYVTKRDIGIQDVCGRKQYASALRSAGNVFAISSSSDPLLGFRLASAFDDSNFSQEELTENVVRLAKTQFQEWCTSFRERVREKGIAVRLYCGDALRFSYALQSLEGNETPETKLLSLFTTAWRSTPLTFDNPGATSGIHTFDVIDTNNLADPLGILNLLPAIAPLLSRKATAVMFTETLSLYTKDPVDILSHILCCDITTFSLLLGLAPSGHLFDFTTYAVGLDAQRQFSIHRNNNDSYHMRVEWRYPNLDDPAGRELIFEPHELALFFFKLYLKMFEIESMSPNTGREIHLLRYNRLGFSALVCLAKGCVKNDQLSTFGGCLLGHIEKEERLRVGGLQLLELSLHFYQLGICAQPFLLEIPHQIMLASQKDFKEGPLSLRNQEVGVGPLDQNKLPRLVWISLSVPREILESLKMDDEYATVGLQIKIRHTKSKTEALFMSLQCFFGSLVQRADDNDAHDVIEDKQGLKGTSNLIVICAVPSLVLMIDSRESTRIQLACLSNRLGANHMYGGAICSYSLDEDNVLILREPPGVRLRPFATDHAAILRTSSASQKPCFVRIKNGLLVETLEIQKNFEHLKTESAIRVRQISPCTISERFNGFEIGQIQFPYPITLHKAIIDISNKVKTLVAKPSLALDNTGYALNSFPVVLDGSDAYPLTLPKVNMNQQPIISGTGRETGEWISNLMHSMFCARERSYWRKSDTALQEDVPALFKIKSYIHNMAVSFVQPSALGRKQTFLFESGDPHSTSRIIFVSALPHNIDQSSIVLDAYLLPLAAESSPITPVIKELLAHKATQPITYGMRDVDEQLMMRMLPATVEACRKGWDHGPGCKYRQHGSVFSYTESNQSPICTCGEGKDAEGFPRVERWKTLSRHATRIALMPLSTVDYLEAHYSQEEHNRSLFPLLNSALTKLRSTIVEELDNTDDEDRDDIREFPSGEEGCGCELTDNGGDKDDCDNDTDISLIPPPYTLPNISIPSE